MRWTEDPPTFTGIVWTDAYRGFEETLIRTGPRYIYQPDDPPVQGSLRWRVLGGDLPGSWEYQEYNAVLGQWTDIERGELPGTGDFGAYAVGEVTTEYLICYAIGIALAIEFLRRIKDRWFPEW
jgi:hypothetical protein